MSTEVTASNLTAEDLLAMPDDGVGRELIRGRLVEVPLTRRNRPHSRIGSRVAQHLANWLDRQPEPRGEVVSGEAAFRLRRDPETFVGVDAAYVSPELAAAISPKASFFDGSPVLAVEILSPSDRQDDVADKVAEYLAAGVAVVWVVDPDFQTVRVHRPDALPALFTVADEISAEPHLPGFRASVAGLFA